MTRRSIATALALALLTATQVFAAAGPAHLDEFSDPYYPDRDTARLITPQWVGEPGVEAVIVLAVDDLQDNSSAKYEQFLRPILERLKQIDGRAPVSIMSKSLPPGDPLVQRWLGEGISLETHTYDHPCPCLQGGDLAKARQTFEQSIESLAAIPGNRPVAYRMPCCDSMNSVSPRFFTEVFNRVTPSGRFLTMDSSVFLVFTADDRQLPRELVLDPDGQPRFAKYLPFDRVMANYVEDYSYPYVVSRLCWEIPSVMPSDWDAQHRNGKCSPQTVSDFKAAVDALVVKQGIFSICFHPHGWIAAEQMVEIIDHAATRHAGRVKFLTFREVQDHLNKNLLAGEPLRAANGQDNGVRVLDINRDGYMDVVVGNGDVRKTRIWSPESATWMECDFPANITTADSTGTRREMGVRFGIRSKTGAVSAMVSNEHVRGWWDFDGREWIRDEKGLDGLNIEPSVYTATAQGDRGVRLRDVDGDGACELIVGNEAQQAVFRWSDTDRRWQKLPFTLPPQTAIVDAGGRDAGLRFVDIDQDGRDDVVFSNGRRASVHLFVSTEDGWSREIVAGPRTGEGEPLPMIVREDGTNNGAWFNHSRLWVQNEETGGKLPDHVDSRSYAALLGK